MLKESGEIIRLARKKLASDKHTSLFFYTVSDEEKKI